MGEPTPRTPLACIRANREMAALALREPHAGLPTMTLGQVPTVMYANIPSVVQVPDTLPFCKHFETVLTSYALAKPF